MSFKNILVVPKHTLLENFITDETSIEDLRTQLKSMDLDADGIIDEHLNHEGTMNAVLNTLHRYSSKGIKFTLVYPEQLPQTDFSEYDLIMPVGGDGTLLHPAHYCFNQLFFGVNSNPQKNGKRGSIGHWLSTDKNDFEKDFEKIINFEYFLKEIPRLEAIVTNGEKHKGIALNEVYFGKLGLKSSRYKIISNEKEEYQQSSGLVVAVKEGATGWLNNIPNALSYEGYEDSIQWINREPKNKGKDYSMNQGFTDGLRIISEDQNNVVSLDSDEKTFCYTLNRGQFVDIKVSNYPLNIIYADRTSEQELGKK